jgi:ABC-2 type transport system permease protein
MNAIVTIFKREFLGYFRSPVAYVFLAVFLVAAVGLPWFIGGFFDTNQASLGRFFDFLPWVFLFLIPAVGMRLWSEEKRSGTWELLFTLPISITHAVVGKFLAGWAFVSLALILTITMPMTVAYLGSPDWGPVFSGYLGAILMAGAYLGICSVASAFTKNQVIAFVISLVLCLVMVLLGWSVFNELMLAVSLPVGMVDALANFSFITHFESMAKGLVRLTDLVFFFSLMAFCLSINILVLER